MNTNSQVSQSRTGGDTLSYPLPVQAQAAMFPSAEQAEAFAQHVAGALLRRPDAAVRAEQIGPEFSAQILLARELFCTRPPIVTPGTVLIDRNGRPVGLAFCAHTEECDSGHEFSWIEDLSGASVHSALIPR